MIKKLTLPPTYKRNSGLFVQDLNAVELPFTVKERSIVYIPSLEVGGNHKHPRTEAFIGLGELELVWEDQEGKRHTEKMNQGDDLILFVATPGTPHTVRNTSTSQFGVLLEFADDKQHDVEMVELV